MFLYILRPCSSPHYNSRVHPHKTMFNNGDPEKDSSHIPREMAAIMGLTSEFVEEILKLAFNNGPPVMDRLSAQKNSKVRTDSPLVSQYETLQKRHRQLMNTGKQVTQNPAPEQEFENKELRKASLAYRVSRPPPSEISDSTLQFVDTGNKLLCTAMATINELSTMFDDVQMSHLSKLYEGLAAREGALWSDTVPAEHEAKLYFTAAYEFVVNVQLIECLVKVPVEEIRKAEKEWMDSA
ncbi:hypothetical protein C8R43DRAFT_1002322, partial [Mycena crocata]